MQCACCPSPSGAAALDVGAQLPGSTAAGQDYVMGEMQQRAAENRQLKEIIFGRNGPALHHFHRNSREPLKQSPLEVLRWFLDAAQRV